MMAKFLKEVVVILVGKQSEPIADLLDSKKHVNEFLIAKKLGLTINQTRNILYKIADHGLVSSVRKKDKRKGWYTYFWKLENLKVLEFLKEMITKKIDNLTNQIRSRETKVFYVCKNCHVEYNEENALLHDFTCPECGEVFIKSDNAKVLKDLRREDEKLRKELSVIEEEIGKEKAIAEKQRLKEKHKFEKEKRDKRKKAMAKMMKARKKAKSKIGHKVKKKEKSTHKKTKSKPKHEKASHKKKNKKKRR